MENIILILFIIIRKCFKEEFGDIPSAYIKRIKDKKGNFSRRSVNSLTKKV